MPTPEIESAPRTAETDAAPPPCDNDHDLERQVSCLLRDLDQSAARGVAVEAGAQGVLTLHGYVKTYYARQLFVQCCRRIPGITAVVDHLHVGP